MKKKLLKGVLLGLLGVGLLAGSASAMTVFNSEVVYSEETEGVARFEFNILDANVKVSQIELFLNENGNTDFANITTDDFNILAPHGILPGASIAYDLGIYTMSINFPEVVATSADTLPLTLEYTYELTGNTVDWSNVRYVLQGEIFETVGMKEEFVDNAASDGNFPVAPVPEPATMMLFGTGLLGLAGVSRRKKAKS